MYTQCPNCYTLFELPEGELKRANGKVRCGECDCVFDAAENQAEEVTDPESIENLDDPRFTETGVGWLMLPAEKSVDEDENDHAEYVPRDDQQAWKAVGRSIDEDASNTGGDRDEPIRYDDNTPLEDIDEPERHAETIAHDPAPVSFTVISSDDEIQETPASADTDTDTDSDDDWHSLLQEIETLPDADGLESELNHGSPSEDVTLLTETGDEDVARIAIDDVGELEAIVLAAGNDAGFLDDVADGFFAETPDIAAGSEPAKSDTDDVLVESDEIEEPAPEAAVNDEADSDSLFAMPTDDDPDDDQITEIDSSGIFVMEDELPDDDATPTTIDDSGIIVVEGPVAEHDDDPEPEPWQTATTSEPEPWQRPDPLPDEAFETAIGFTASEPKQPAGPLSRLLVLALILSGAAQLVHHNRDALATRPELNPALTAIYGERLKPSWPITNICYQKHEAVAANGEMLIVAELTNQASSAQPYPLVHVSLTGRFETGNGARKVGHRVVEPDEYLEPAQHSEYVGSGVGFRATVRLRDPGPEVTGYDLEACYRRSNGQLVCSGGC